MQLDGIYGGIETVPLDINATVNIGAQMVHIAFFPDGSVFWGLPPEGLGGALPSRDSERWKSDWGRYLADANQVRVSFNYGDRIGTWKKERLHFERDGSGRKMSCILWPRLSGRALDGMYQPAPEYPGIGFTDDGRFLDEGFQSMLGTISTSSGDTRQSQGVEEADRRRAGAGTFSLGNYTLELRYDDGRLNRLPLLVAPINAEQLPVSLFEVFGQQFRHQ